MSALLTMDLVVYRKQQMAQGHSDYLEMQLANSRPWDMLPDNEQAKHH